MKKFQNEEDILNCVEESTLDQSFSRDKWKKLLRRLKLECSIQETGKIKCKYCLGILNNEESRLGFHKKCHTAIVEYSKTRNPLREKETIGVILRLIPRLSDIYEGIEETLGIDESLYNPENIEIKPISNNEVKVRIKYKPEDNYDYYDIPDERWGIEYEPSEKEAHFFIQRFSEFNEIRNVYELDEKIKAFLKRILRISHSYRNFRELLSDKINITFHRIDRIINRGFDLDRYLNANIENEFRKIWQIQHPNLPVPPPESFKEYEKEWELASRKLKDDARQFLSHEKDSDYLLHKIIRGLDLNIINQEFINVSLEEPNLNAFSNILDLYLVNSIWIISKNNEWIVVEDTSDINNEYLRF